MNLERYADPAVLREFSPRMLVALLDEARPYLAGRGVELPTVAEIQAANGEAVLDYEALAPVFTAMADIPKELVDRFHMVKQMSGPRQMDLILATVRERQLDFALPLEHGSPEDLAAHLLLTKPKLFQELHAQAAVARYRRFAYYVPRGKKRPLELPATLAAWEKSLNSWYEEHLRDRSAHVFWRRHGEEYLFYVRHGEPVKREGTVGLVVIPMHVSAWVSCARITVRVWSMVKLQPCQPIPPILIATPTSLHGCGRVMSSPVKTR